jgi:inner membrane protein
MTSLDSKPRNSQRYNPEGSFQERYSTTIKLVIIGILTLVLLIPLLMIQSLINERQTIRQNAVEEITSKWGGKQTIAGPCFVIPYTKTLIKDDLQTIVEQNLVLLPETLEVSANATVEKRKRGIYDASVYRSDIVLEGTFDMQALEKSGISLSQIKWDDVRLILGISDLKGIKEISPLQIAGNNVDFEPGIPARNLSLGFGSSAVIEKQSATKEKTGSLFGQGMNAKMTFYEEDSLLHSKSLPFSISLKLNGSQGFYVVPVGKLTKVHLKSDWTTPGFDGNFLPDSRNIDHNGFTADWKILDINRSYGQIINGDDDASMSQMTDSRFGVQFVQSVDQYQQNMRAVKYGILIILLTFVAVFFMEMILKKTVHPFQDLLIGLALVLFYSLLLSLSEILGFAPAYLIAAAMTAVLISIHLSSIFRSTKQGWLVGALLAILYGFIFMLIHMESYALLAGSLGLFVILALMMYFSKKFDL